MESADPFRDDTELSEMLRRLRFERDQELAELEEEAERLTAKQSTLPQVALTAMMAGETWSVSFGERSFDGHVVHVGDDFVGLGDKAGNLADIGFRAIDYIRHLDSDPARSRTPMTLRPVTLRGRLVALQEGRSVEVGGILGGWVLAGVIDSVNTDHLTLMSTSGRSTVPMTSIGFVLRRPVETRRQR